jgi:hypothetical protein
MTALTFHAVFPGLGLHFTATLPALPPAVSEVSYTYTFDLRGPSFLLTVISSPGGFTARPTLLTVPITCFDQLLTYHVATFHIEVRQHFTEPIAPSLARSAPPTPFLGPSLEHPEADSRLSVATSLLTDVLTSSWASPVHPGRTTVVELTLTPVTSSASNCLVLVHRADGVARHMFYVNDPPRGKRSDYVLDFGARFNDKRPYTFYFSWPPCVLTSGTVHAFHSVTHLMAAAQPSLPIHSFSLY